LQISIAQGFLYCLERMQGKRGSVDLRICPQVITEADDLLEFQDKDPAGIK